MGKHMCKSIFEGNDPNCCFKMRDPGTSLAVQRLRLHLPMQGVRVQSLVRELRSHMPWGQKKRHKYCNKFNKDFKNGPHQKKKNLKEKKEGPQAFGEG